MLDAVRRTFRQFADLFGGLTPSQRGLFLAVPLIVFLALGYLVVRDGRSANVALSWGKVFSTEEVIAAEQLLREAGLLEFRREGQQIFVPAAKVEQYNAALLVNGGLPQDFASEWERKFEKTSIFTSKEQLQAMKEIALAKELRRVIRAIPDVEDGTVIWARATRPSRRGDGRPAVTATVNVRPRRGREISPRLVRSLRTAVASMVPDLSSEDVTVFDQSTGQSFREEPEGSAFDTRLLARRHEFATMYRDRIAAALSYVPDVLVTVDVDLDNLKSSVVREQTVDPKKTVALAQSETTRSSTATQRPSVAEPGQVPNRPRELQAGPGQDRSHVTSDSATSSVSAASFTVSEKQFLAALPTSIQVAVQIPEDYYAALEQRRAPAAGTGTTPGTDGTGAAAAAVPTKKREEVERDVKAAVARAIGAGSKVDDISVTSYVRIAPVVPPLDVPVMETVQEGVRQWGGPVVLVLLTVWVLRFATRSLPALPAAPTSDSPAVAVLRKGKAAEEPQPTPSLPELSPRDRLQTVVRDNPEMTADLIAKWIQAAK